MAHCCSLTTVSPNSWQLHRGFGLAPFAPLPGRGPPALLPCGIRRSELSIRSNAVAGKGRGEEEEKKTTPGNRSWLEADSASTNSYAGWSSADPTHNRKSLTGYLAAGAAGLVLTIGFAFASHSFYSRRGMKSLVMMPLVAEQEKILSTDSSSSADGDYVGEQGELPSRDVHEQKQNEESGMSAEVSGELHETAGTNQSSLLHKETNGLRFEGGEGDLSNSAMAVSIQNVELKESESGPIDVVPVTDSKDVVSSPLPDFTTTTISENLDSFAILPDSEPNSVATTESANSSSLASFHTENKSVSNVSESDGAASTLHSETEVSSTFPNVEVETSAVSTVSESGSMYLHTKSQNGEPRLEVGESFMEKDPTISDNAFLSDSTVLEPIIPTDVGITQDSSLPIASDVPESTREIKQFIPSNEASLASETIASVVVTDGSETAVAQTMSESGLNEKNDALDLALLSSESEHFFPSAGIPAPSLRSPALYVAPGKVVVPAVVDHVQGQAFAALQALKVVEAGVEPSGLSTRREYARWLIASSAILARNPASKVFPAMFIENVTELAFDDVTPEDPDFPYIQGLAVWADPCARLVYYLSSLVHAIFFRDRSTMAESEINYTDIPQTGINSEESTSKEMLEAEEVGEKKGSTPEKCDSQKQREEENPMEQNPADEGPSFQSPPPPSAAASSRCPCGAPVNFPNRDDFGLSPPPVPTNYRPIRAPALLTPPNTQAVILAPVPQAQKVSIVSPPYSFQIPCKRISSPADIEHFHNSDSGRSFMGFVVALSESIRGHKISDECYESPSVKGIVEILGIMDVWIDEIPPVQQPARYGNPAFRQWQDRLHQGQELMDRLLEPDIRASIPEIFPYFTDSFGNATRIDYGTGHEANFAAWLFCLARLGVITENDYQAVVSRVFVKYLGLMRRLQTTYWLEPAGSHGVWGLDDYHFLPFIFGSSQLVDHKYMKPKSIHNQDILDNFSDEYFYLSCVAFVKKVKKGHLAEHSPMIDDISAVPNWGKVNSGMLKMYKAEVLEKVPIMQHFLFGSLIKWE